ncbi:FtsX-like permease family protein [Clostridium fungisolvens]|uniref:ABC transporter permease protein YxdM n=1 Tax=Clostridium fungisolvens TaxID=1604897 RepID=A0A6V8SEE9_9CLOT|nr:ABC transporter permease [Clostridium fungisolvens]GFP74845.1 ABC transporter permease protein YxdM [Clostridium fungisolvens]
MTLVSITTRNIKKNFKNYWSYFLSLSFSVFSVYLFMSILYSKYIQDELGDMKKFITLFNVGAVMIVMFSAFFIWYSNSFFIKSRKKEFATYMLLGMSKNQVAKINFYENTFITAIALITGIALGLIFSKFFIMILFYMVKISSAVPFQWNLRAIKMTLKIFVAIYVIISIHGSIIVRNSNLIDLFNASKRGERGLKVSAITFLFTIVSVVCMYFGYSIAIQELGSNLLKAPIVVALVVVGTILLFTSATSFLIYINKKNEKSLFKGTKLISTSQLYFRYRGNVGTLSIIAISTTVALCALVTCVGSYTRAEENSRYMRPFSVEYFKTKDENAIFDRVLANHKEISVKYSDELELIIVNAEDPINNKNSDFYVIRQSDFNKINEHQKVDRKAELDYEDDCYFIQVQSFAANKSALNKRVNINLKDKNYSLKVAQTDIKPFTALDHFNQTFVVKDNIYDSMKLNSDKSKIIKLKGYILDNDFKAENFLKDLGKSLYKESGLVTFYEHYTDGLKLLGMMAFIGVFIGALFITATGSIIYFKMEMEATEDKEKFITLSKIGVSKSEIKSAVAKELGLLFGAPFMVAVINSLPATIALGKMLSLKLMNSFIVIASVYGLIYCVYYFVTLNSYTKIVVSKNA